VHFAAPQVEVDVVVREHPGKLLGDPAELEDGKFVHQGAILSWK
jgi:hypothetical protein